MKKNSIASALAAGTNPTMLAAKVLQRPALLEKVFDGLDADEARVKFGCLKILRTISGWQPGALYPEIGRFFRLMNHKNTILQWGAIIIIGNLASVDEKRKIDRILTQYLKPISGGVMITAANVIEGAGRIAQAKPRLADRIARALLRVEKAKYQTPECRNVALGHVVDSLDGAFANIRQRRPVVQFVRRQLNNSRPPVRKKAAKFLRRHDK